MERVSGQPEDDFEDLSQSPLALSFDEEEEEEEQDEEMEELMMD